MERFWNICVHVTQCSGRGLNVHIFVEPGSCSLEAEVVKVVKLLYLYTNNRFLALPVTVGP